MLQQWAAGAPSNCCVAKPAPFSTNVLSSSVHQKHTCSTLQSTGCSAVMFSGSAPSGSKGNSYGSAFASRPQQGTSRAKSTCRCVSEAPDEG